MRKTDTAGAPVVSAGANAGVLVWDWPTRVVHWSFVVLVVLAWLSAADGHMDWHRYCGYALLGLIVFRLYWGVVGSTASRFQSFVRGPQSIFAYLRTLPERGSPKSPGHNPVGALSVLALLLSLLAEVVLGLFTVDVDGIESGPLARWISFDAGRACARWHHLVFNGLVGLIALHLAAIAFYAAYKRENLIGPMIHGRKLLPAGNKILSSLSPRVLVGTVLSVTLVWLTTRAFDL